MSKCWCGESNYKCSECEKQEAWDEYPDHIKLDHINYARIIMKNDSKPRDFGALFNKYRHVKTENIPDKVMAKLRR